MYINLKKSNANNYKMARLSLKVQLGTQEGMLYVSLSKADSRKGLEVREVFAAAGELCTSLHALFSLCLGLPTSPSALNTGK